MPSRSKTALPASRRPRTAAPVSPSERSPGHRAGLTWDKIVMAARHVLSAGSGPITVKAVALELGVAHNSIGSRLKREATTLERELARDFLFGLSSPMRPGENWRSSLRRLFDEAIKACRAEPRLARAVIPWLGHDPTLCPEFTERVLYLFQSAGLAGAALITAHEVTLSSLCGMLTVQSPEFGGTSKHWAIRVTRAMGRIDKRRTPLFHANRRELTAVVKAKLPNVKVSLEPAAVMSDLVIRLALDLSKSGTSK